MILSDEYREFIINMKNPESYVDSICDYESIFQNTLLIWDLKVRHIATLKNMKDMFIILLCLGQKK